MLFSLWYPHPGHSERKPNEAMVYRVVGQFNETVESLRDHKSENKWFIPGNVE